MTWRRRRTAPTFTQLQRIERVLEGDPAIRLRLGPKTTPARKRNGDVVCCASETVTVAQELMARRLNPERVKVKVVLAVAAEVLGLVVETEDSVSPTSQY